MKQKIAIEPSLTPVKDFLSNKGYQVDNVNFGEGTRQYTGQYDAYVVTGLDTNFMGIGDTSTKAVVVNASGLTPQQVYQQLQSKLGS